VPRWPLVVAHRGGAGLAPENTLGACLRAVALGVDAVEVDVRLTADGVPVLLHDATLDRTTSGRGAVAAWMVAEVRGLDATATFPARGLAPEPPPTLAETLTVLRGGTESHVELKGDPLVSRALVDAVLDVVAQGDTREVLLISFDWDALTLAGTLAPGVRLGALTSAWPARGAAWLVRLRAMGVEWLGVRHGTLTPARVAAAHAAGLRVGVWTVNATVAMRRAVALGVDAITTDRPDRLLAVLASVHGSP
jgi:glycerophosphoryl diester phosphodiesterase